jgi:hypothetical protein
VRVHQSFVNSGAAALLAGKTVTDPDFVREMKARVGPDRVRPLEDEPFSVTFAAGLPVVTTFADNQVRTVIRTRGFTAGDRVYDDPYDLNITYELARVETGLVLERREIRARDPEGKPLAGRTFTIARILTRRFEDRLPKRVQLDNPRLPENLKKIGQLITTQGQSDGGWLTLAWRREANP